MSIRDSNIVISSNDDVVFVFKFDSWWKAWIIGWKHFDMVMMVHGDESVDKSKMYSFLKKQASESDHTTKLTHLTVVN